jgi:hypothetical protein
LKKERSKRCRVANHQGLIAKNIVREERYGMSQQGVTPRSKDYSKWYTDVVLKSELADYYTPVHGCMIIKPYGYELWENVTRMPISRCLSR